VSAALAAEGKDFFGYCRDGAVLACIDCLAGEHYNAVVGAHGLVV